MDSMKRKEGQFYNEERAVETPRSSRVGHNGEGEHSKARRAHHQQLLDEFLRRPENRECAECTALAPRWASVNLGVFICVRCASIHRKLGVDFSKVKSVSLDSWTDEQVETMRAGNLKVRAHFEAALIQSNQQYSKPDESQDDLHVETWIRDKYVRRSFVLSQMTASPNATLEARISQSSSPRPPAVSPNAVLPAASDEIIRASETPLANVDLLDFDSYQTYTTPSDHDAASMPASHAVLVPQPYVPPPKTREQVKEDILSLFNTAPAASPRMMAVDGNRMSSNPHSPNRAFAYSSAMVSSSPPSRTGSGTFAPIPMHNNVGTPRPISGGSFQQPMQRMSPYSSSPPASPASGMVASNRQISWGWHGTS